MNNLPIGSLWVSREDTAITRIILAVVPAYTDSNGTWLITYYDATSDYTASVIATTGDWTYDWRCISP
jgi:hypothetical protein